MTNDTSLPFFEQNLSRESKFGLWYVSNKISQTLISEQNLTIMFGQQ